VHEHASGLTSTPKAELFCRCKRRKFIGQNKVKMFKFQSQSFTFSGQKIGSPRYDSYKTFVYICYHVFSPDLDVALTYHPEVQIKNAKLLCW